MPGANDIFAQAVPDMSAERVLCEDNLIAQYEKADTGETKIYKHQLALEGLGWIGLRF
jgi:hypothetical protein